MGKAILAMVDITFSHHETRKGRMGNYAFVSGRSPLKLRGSRSYQGFLGHVHATARRQASLLILIVPRTEKYDLLDVQKKFGRMRDVSSNYYPYPRDVREVQWFDVVRVSRNGPGLRIYFKKGTLSQIPEKGKKSGGDVIKKNSHMLVLIDFPTEWIIRLQNRGNDGITTSTDKGRIPKGAETSSGGSTSS